MAINRTYNYNDLRSEVTKEIKGVVSEGATQGLTEGMAEALAHGLKGKIKINGNNIVFDDGDLKDGIRVAFNKALNDFDIKDAVKKQGLDISQLFNIDTNVLKQEIQDSLDEVDINPKSIKANKKLLGQLLAAEFRGIEVKDLDGATITQSFIRSIQRAAKISNEQIADINDGFKQLGDSSKQLDVFAENVTELLIRMQNAADGINDTKREISEFNKLLEGLDDQSFDKINDSLDEFQEKIQKGVMSASEAFAELRTRFNLDAVADDLKEFNGLLDMALTGFGSKSKPSAQQYWKNFSEGFEAANEDVKDLLKNLGLLNQSGGVDIIESGANNYGGIVGEQNTAIIRKNNGNITPENALELKNALDQAADAGVNCGRIIDVVSDKTNEFFVEVQSTQAGKAISTIGDEFESINTAALEASDEQIQKLFSDLKKLYDLGIQIDPENLTNILYDPAKGFGFIDLDLGKGNAAFESFEEMISAFRTTLGYQVDDIKTILEDEAGSKLMEGFVKRIANASSGIGDAVADLQRAGLDELAKSLDSHSPSKKAENIGESVPQGEAKGIRNEIPEAEKAAKELGQATMDALKKELEPVSGNQYADILNRSFETKNKTEANSQLKTAFEEYQKYFGEKGLDKGKITHDMSDAGREAGFNYIKALEEAVSKGVAKNRISKYLIDDFRGVFDEEQAGMIKGGFSEYIHEQARVLQELGNPKLDQASMKALSDYMERWDLLRAHQGDTDLFNDEDIRNDTELLRLMREELEAVIKAEQQAATTKLADEQKRLEAQKEELTKFHQMLDEAYGEGFTSTLAKTNFAELEKLDSIIEQHGRTAEEAFEHVNKLYLGQSEKGIKAESEAHKENAENIQKEADAKKESEQHSPTPETTPQIKAEAEAHAENTENIQKEAEAKKESRTEDEKKSSVDDQMARYQQYIAELQKVRDEKKAIYDEEAAYLRELQIKSDGIFAQAQDTRKYDHYKESFDNAKLSNFDFIKDQPVSHVDALWQRFVDHGKRYLNTGDDAALGKAAGYYKQYADAVREAGEEVQRAKIGQNDLTDKLVSEAEALEKTKGITFDTKELNAVNIEIVKVRENVEKLEAEYDKAQKKLDKAESEMMAAQLSPAVQQQLQLREEANKATEAVKKQKEAMQAPAESMDGAVESEQKLADAEEKVAEKAKEAADAKEQENAAGDNSKAVEQAKEEEAAIEKKTAARQRSLEVKKEEQKTEGGSKTSAQIEEEVSELNKLNAAYERRVQQQKEVQVSQALVVIKAEDLSPVLMQLTNIIGLLERKNNLFIREGNIVTEEAARESSSLQGVANVLKEIVGDLQALNGKGVKLSFSGLSNLKQLTELDVDKLDERLIDAFDKIADFAKELGGLKVDDSSFVKSINDMLKHGEELKNLATALKASKKQIDNVTEAISKPKEQSKTKVDLSAWKELKSAVQEYYELKNTDSDKLTQSEQGRLTEIEGLWAKVRGEVEKTTAALKEQGQSTKLIEDVTRAYTTGFAEWQKQQMVDDLDSDRTNLSKLSERFNKRLNDYPSKYVEEAKQQVQQLTAMVDALNAKPIDASKPEDIAQIREEIAAAKELANAIQQGFNSADWKVANQTKVSNLQNEISMYMKNFSALSEETKGKLHALIEELDHIGSNEGLAQAVQKFNKIKIAARDAGEEGTSFFSKMGKQVEHLNAQAFAMYLSWRDIIRYIRQAARAVIELDSALTELRKITGESTERMEQSFKTSAVTAKELGSTIDAVISQTSDWSRLKNMDGRMVTCAMELA